MLTFLFAIMIAKLILKGKLQNMEVSTSPITLFTIIFILLLAALFTLLEYSLIKVRPTELKELKQTSSVRRAENMIEHLTEYLSTAQVGVTMTSLILGWIGEAYITELLEKVNIFPKSVANLPTWFLKTWQLTSQLRFCWRLPTQ